MQLNMTEKTFSEGLKVICIFYIRYICILKTILICKETTADASIFHVHRGHLVRLQVVQISQSRALCDKSCTWCIFRSQSSIHLCTSTLYTTFVPHTCKVNEIYRSMNLLFVIEQALDRHQSFIPLPQCLMIWNWTDNQDDVSIVLSNIHLQNGDEHPVWKVCVIYIYLSANMVVNFCQGVDFLVLHPLDRQFCLQYTSYSSARSIFFQIV